MSDLILSGRRSFERHRDLLESAAGPEARWLLMNDDKTIVDAETGAEIDFDDATPTIAWCGIDIFRSPAGRRFFKFVELCPTLEWVQTAYAGHDAPIWRMLLDRDVQLTRAHIAGIPIAEFVMGAVMRHYQQPQKWVDARASRSWTGHIFREVHGTRWVVVGLGGIGRGIAARARALGAHVTGVNRSGGSVPEADRTVTLGDLDEALDGADVVVLAVPANADSDLLLDARRLALLAPDAVAVNIGRGNSIDETALLEALDAGSLGHAVLDVFATEPLPQDSPMWDHPKIFATAHVSSMGDGRFGRAAQVFAANLERRRLGHPLADPVLLDDLG